MTTPRLVPSQFLLLALATLLGALEPLAPTFSTLSTTWAQTDPNTNSTDDSTNNSSDANPSNPGLFSELGTRLSQGGLLGILVMLALLVISMAGLALAVEQAFHLRHGIQAPPQLQQELERVMPDFQFNQADFACQQHPSYLAHVVQAGLAQREFGYDALEKAMEDASHEQAHRLLRRVDHLGLIGNLAPMLGLLGTVYGLVLAFGEIAQTNGSAKVGQLAQGIYTALGTTVLGLVIAIPSLACYAIFRGRIEHLANDIHQLVEKYFLPYRRQLRQQPLETSSNSNVLSLTPSNPAPATTTESDPDEAETSKPDPQPNSNQLDSPEPEPEPESEPEKIDPPAPRPAWNGEAFGQYNDECFLHPDDSKDQQKTPNPTPAPSESSQRDASEF